MEEHTMIGQTISAYKILDKLGEGGMGVVYKARDTKLDRDVALKFLPQYLTSDANERERLYHEARAASNLMHPNVAVIFEINEFDGRLFIAMEYVEGRTLKKFTEQSEPLPVKKVLDIAIQVCDGLAAAHEKGVIHRDIKSDNIMITPKGQVKIMDFGLAKVKGATKLTKAGSTLGTAAYMSPEQAQGEEVDHRSDIFSFGVVLYELLTGKLPFRGEHQAALLYSLINENPPAIARFNESVSPDLDRVVTKALAKDRDERYQHIDDMLADLRRERKAIEYVTSGYVRAPATTVEAVPKQNKNKRLYILAGAAALLLVVVAILLNPWGLQFGKRTSVPGERKSVAVLPFTNLSENKEDDSFCDGMTEDILTQLSKIGDLKVYSRTSLMRYKGTQKSIREIGNELGVATILEGSIRRAGDRIRITGQLVDAASEEQIWADNYDREMKDVFEIQSEVAKSIASALHAKLSVSEQSNIERKPTDNLEAYGYYLRGRQYYYRYHNRDNDNAIDLFKKALALDPDYALAYAGLGDCYGQRKIKYGYPEAWIDSGIAASQKAISLDPTLAEGYKALGLGYGAKGLVGRSLDAYYKAIERNPNYTPATGNIAILNYARGNYAESYRWAMKDAKLAALEPYTLLERGYIYFGLTEDAQAEQWFRRALDLQPDFVYASLMLSAVSLYRGDFAKAKEYCHESLAADPDNITTLNAVANIELFSGDFVSAKEHFEKAYPFSKAVGDFTLRGNATGLGFSLVMLGRRVDGLKFLTESRRLHQDEVKRGNEWSVVRYELATIAAVEGNKTEAYRWLQEAIDIGWRDYRYAQRDPMLQALGNDDQFIRLVADMKSRIEEQRKLVRELEKQ